VAVTSCVVVTCIWREEFATAPEANGVNSDKLGTERVYLQRTR